MTPRCLLRGLFLLGLAGLSACAGPDRRLVSSTTQYLTSSGGVVERASTVSAVDDVSYWDGDGVAGAPSITIQLSEQRAYFYKGGRLVGVSRVSTGREGYRTPAGRFKIIQKNRDHVSNLYGNYVDAGGNVVVSNVGVKRDPRPPGTTFSGAPMPYFMRIHGGVGMHAGFLPGFPDSHGCIRLPEHMAERFFAHAPLGTPVAVTY